MLVPSQCISWGTLYWYVWLLMIYKLWWIGYPDVFQECKVTLFPIVITEEVMKKDCEMTQTSFSLKKKYVYREVLGSQQHCGESAEIFIYARPHMCLVSPFLSIPYQSGTFVAVNEPTLKHLNHSKSIRVLSWPCTFCGFGQMYNDMYLTVQYYAD